MESRFSIILAPRRDREREEREQRRSERHFGPLGSKTSYTQNRVRRRAERKH